MRFATDQRTEGGLEKKKASGQAEHESMTGQEVCSDDGKVDGRNQEYPRKAPAKTKVKREGPLREDWNAGALCRLKMVHRRP